MSIQSEINRIAGAKSDIADAIEDKGVTVPSGTKLDGMANLIGQISDGSGKLNSTQAADAYDPTATYAVGDKVSYAGNVYSCISAISTPEAWDSTHWDQVDPIQDQVDDVRNTLIHKADVIYDTASGDIASFPDGADGLPAKDLMVAIEPVQDLHGYDNPWPAGGNINLIPTGTDTSNGYVANNAIKSDGTYVSTPNYYVSEYFTITAGEVYSFCLYPSATDQLSFCFYDSEKNYISGYSMVSGKTTVTAPENAVYCRASGHTLAAYETATFKSLLCVGSTKPASWSPYSNICPISGWTGCNVARTGKNLLPSDIATLKAENTAGVWSGKEYSFRGVTASVNDDGSVSVTGTATGGNFAFYYPMVDLGSLNVVANGGNNQSTVITSFIQINKFNKNGGAALILGYVTTENTSVLIDDPDYTYKVIIYVLNGVSVSNMIYHPMIRLASDTDSTFVPYNPSSVTIPASWQSSAGTVYAASLDALAGLLKVRPYYASYNGETLVGPWISSMDAYTPVGTPTTGAQVVDFGGSETLYSLDSIALNTLLGQNNIFADCGPVSVEYPADTKLYIQKINTPTDDDMIADANIASGQYFIVNNNLYLSTAAILAGDPIKPGTNCTLTNLAAALNALNS